MIWILFDFLLHVICIIRDSATFQFRFIQFLHYLCWRDQVIEKVRYPIILAGTAGNPGDQDLPDGTPGRSASAVRHARSKYRYPSKQLPFNRVTPSLGIKSVMVSVELLPRLHLSIADPGYLFDFRFDADNTLKFLEKVKFRNVYGYGSKSPGTGCRSGSTKMISIRADPDPLH